MAIIDERDLDMIIDDRNTDFNLTLITQRLPGVNQQVQENLIELTGITIDARDVTKISNNSDIVFDLRNGKLQISGTLSVVITMAH